ncbi:zinc dependent phospholipase C family protein [Clostridium oceanicum]|uniref:Phospholipase C n=1 Tax=Clostridium oceanicum TaxID=1543 RepID=A0ABP3V0N0_9CLOT
MKRKLEKTYGSALKGVFYAVNPLKKKLLKTNCTVHKYINIRGLELLKIEGYEKEYKFFKKYIGNLNEGVSWADQDFKSSNHFYHFNKNKGLFGFSNALTECERYYKKAITFLKRNEIEKSMFYFGAACHLVQDVTVPQHVNNRLLKSHRKFEMWIISKLFNDYSFKADRGINKYKSVEDFIKNNAYMANNIYIKSSYIYDTDQRYQVIASKILTEAQKSTAGFMVLFYNDIISFLP